MKKIWVDLFEMPQLRGRCRRLLGAGVYKNLRSPLATLGTMFESLSAGPQTYVRLFDSAAATEAIWWMRPGTIVESVDRLARGAQINALELTDHAPQPGDAGYEFYSTFAPLTANGH